MPIHNAQNRYVSGQLIRATPRWQPATAQPGFQMPGGLRAAGPHGAGPAIRPMTAPVSRNGIQQPHRIDMIQQRQQPIYMQQAGRQGFKYTPNVRNPAAMPVGVNQQAQVQQQVETPAQPAVHIQGQEPLTPGMLAAAPPHEQRQMLGERLYPLIESQLVALASKITGMLLEIDNSELLHMLESRDSLKAKMDEAVAVLQAHQAKVAAANRQVTQSVSQASQNQTMSGVSQINNAAPNPVAVGGGQE